MKHQPWPFQGCLFALPPAPCVSYVRHTFINIILSWLISLPPRLLLPYQSLTAVLWELEGLSHSDHLTDLSTPTHLFLPHWELKVLKLKGSWVMEGPALL